MRIVRRRGLSKTGNLHGRWIDVPHVEGALVVNFGKLLELWTGGHIRATEHRVLGNESTRCSIPFFYEPRVDARIEPLDLDGAAPFEPFLYGDHLWQAMSEFPEFHGARRFSGDRPQVEARSGTSRWDQFDQ